MISRHSKILPKSSDLDFKPSGDDRASNRVTAAKKINGFLKYQIIREKLKTLSSAMIQEVSTRRLLIHGYKTTAQLAESYNKASIFDRFQKDTTSLNLLRNNPFEIQLERVARQVIENYCSQTHPGSDTIMELASLSSMQHKDTNIGVFNSLIPIMESFKPGNTQIIDMNKVKGVARMIRLLPPGFLSGENSDKILNTLSKFSEWLGAKEGHFNDEEFQIKKLIDILKIFTELLDALLDNKQLQEMDAANRGKEVHEIGGGNKAVSLSTMFENLQRTLFQEFSSNFITVLQEKAFENLNDIAKNPSSFFENLRGDGMDPKVRDHLKKGVERLIDHHSQEISYLARYATECIARLPVIGESRMAQLGQRSMHLILAAKSVGVLVASSGASAGEYLLLLKHAKGAMTDTRLPRNEWYYPARQIGAMMLEAGEDSEKLRQLLNEIDDQLQHQVNSNWELGYMMLTHLWENVEKTNDNKLKNDVVNLFARLVMDVSRYGKSKAVTKIAVDLLLDIARYPEKEIRLQASSHCRNIYDRFGQSHMFWCCFPSRIPKEICHQLDQVESLQVKDYPLLEKQPLEDISLLTIAKRKAYPLEFKVNHLRDSVDRFCKETGITETLEGYIPLKGAVSKYETNVEQFFLLEKKREFFYSKNKRKREGTHSRDSRTGRFGKVFICSLHREKTVDAV